MQLDGINGRVAFVTGGARGIGRCIAETLRDQGAKVAAGDLQPPSIDGVLGVRLDVADEQVPLVRRHVNRQIDLNLDEELHGYAIRNPPLTSTTAPVMKLAWSEQRKATTSAISCGRP